MNLSKSNVTNRALTSSHWYCTLALAIILLGHSSYSFAESGAIALWPEGAPGSEDWEQVESETLDLLPNRVVRNVVAPSITPYLADAEKNSGVAVIVAPGGGFKFLSIDTEGNDVARWLREKGVNAFVLKYRTDESFDNLTLFKLQIGWEILMAVLGGSDGYPKLPDSPVRELAIEDGMAAVRMVRERASEWGIDQNQVGILGFSAGGTVSTGTAMRGSGTSRPNFAASVYGDPDATGVPGNAPPLLLVATEDDPLIPVALATSLHEAWQTAGFDSSLILYPDGGHGFGMQQKGASSDIWIDDFYDWLVQTTQDTAGDS
ncbi:MAG: hypothetical protein Hals2KO_12850 [Halioglobus sp.]